MINENDSINQFGSRRKFEIISVKIDKIKKS